jgi:hypothetical protein
MFGVGASIAAPDFAPPLLIAIGLADAFTAGSSVSATFFDGEVDTVASGVDEVSDDVLEGTATGAGTLGVTFATFAAVGAGCAATAIFPRPHSIQAS